MSKHLLQSYFDEADDDDDDECVEMPKAKGGKFTSGGSKDSNSMFSKRPKTKGPLDMFFGPNPADVVKARKEGKDQGRQKTLNETCKEELRNKVIRDIARFFYDGISLDSSMMVLSLLIYLHLIISCHVRVHQSIWPEFKTTINV